MCFIIYYCFRLSHPILTFAKLLAAFGTRSGQIEGMHEFFDIWFGHMKPLFEAKTFVLKVLCLFIFLGKENEVKDQQLEKLLKIEPNSYLL